LLGITKSNTRAISVTVNNGLANVSTIAIYGFQAAYTDGFSNVIDILYVSAGMHKHCIAIIGSFNGSLDNSVVPATVLLYGQSGTKGQAGQDYHQDQYIHTHHRLPLFIIPGKDLPPSPVFN